MRCSTRFSSGGCDKRLAGIGRDHVHAASPLHDEGHDGGGRRYPSVARRRLLKVFDDHFECGDWNIPYSAIDEAILFRTRQMLIPCYVLRVKSSGVIYQFGLNPGRFWSGALPFAVVREKAVLHYSWFSIGVRLAAVLALLYLWWTRR